MAAEYRMSAGVRGALVIAAVLTALGVAIGGTATGLILAPPITILLIFAMAQMPLRYSMYGLLFFVYTLPNPAEGSPVKDWSAPFSGPGAILLNHINTVDRDVGALSFIIISGLDFMFLVLAAIHFYRRMTGSKIDSLGGRLPTPKPMIRLAWLSLATSAFVEFTGILRGGDFNISLWQLNSVMYLPCIFLLFQAALRGPQDFPALFKTLLIAVVYKSLLAIYVHNFFTVPMDPETGNTKPAYATSHTDSIFFATVLVVFVILLLERVSKKTWRWALFFMPLVAGAIVANSRRIAWAEVGIALMAVAIVSRPSKLKKRLVRLGVASIPVFIGYVIAGWNSAYGTLFKPVRLIRSITDAKSDASSQWREFENVNIIATFRHNPIFGTGYGHPFEEVIKLPAVDYPLERYTPHNSLLGLWCYSGLTGFLGLTLLWAAGMYFAMRAYKHSEDKLIRASALSAYVAFLIYLMQSWGDIGLGTWMGTFLAGGAFAVASKAAVAAGQWNGAPTSSAKAAAAAGRPSARAA
jgi:hypothetical protein